MKIRSQQDFVTGAVFLGVAGLFGFQAWSYTLGTAGQMGPGFFPVMLSLCLALVGFLQCVKAVQTDGNPLSALNLRPLASLVGGVLVFGVLVADFGLAASIVGLVCVGSLGGYRYRWWELALLSGLLILFSVLIFVYALGIQIPVWPNV